MNDPYRRPLEVDPALLAVYNQGVVQARGAYSADHPTDSDRARKRCIQQRRRRQA